MAEGLLSISIETVRVLGIEIPDPQQGQFATPLDGPGRRVSGIEPSQYLPVSNCSVKLRARPPAGLSSVPTEEPTKRPPSTSIGLGAESGDETRAVGTIWSVRQPCRGVSRLASTLGWPVLGGPAATMAAQRRHRRNVLDRCGEDAGPTGLPHLDRTVTVRQRPEWSNGFPFTKRDSIRGL